MKPDFTHFIGSQEDVNWILNLAAQAVDGHEDGALFKKRNVIQ